MVQKRKKSRPGAPAPKKKNADPFFVPVGRRVDDEELSDDNAGSDKGAEDEGGRDHEEEDEEDENETAEEKRLRLARAYLERMKGELEAEALDDEGDRDDDDDDEGGGAGRGDALAERLRQDAMEASGQRQRQIAARVVDPTEGCAERTWAIQPASVWKGHHLAITAVCLTQDDATAFSTSKDRGIFRWDVETGARTKFAAPPADKDEPGQGQAAAKGGKMLLCAAVTDDGQYLATGGSDWKVRIWDARTCSQVRVFAGHRGAVMSMVFRQGSHQLFTGSADRSVKVWSVDDLAYMQSLFGHQADVLGLDCWRRERPVSVSDDRTCRIWKVQDEAQLVCRGHSAPIDCCALISPSEWITGSQDGSVGLWSDARKKPVRLFHGAHAPGALTASKQGQAPTTNASKNAAIAKDASSQQQAQPRPTLMSAASSSPAAEAWVSAVACCRGTDLAASGAGSGFVRLWAAETGNRALRPLHALPATGFVNSLAFAHSGRFLLAGMGQEPRLGRWAQNKNAKNCIVMHKIELSSE